MRLKARGLFAFVALVLLALSGCRQAAFALLPRAPMGPQRTNDPFAPLGPPAAARAPENRAPTVTTAAGKVDVGLSGASLLNTFLGGDGFLGGIYGTFEENDLFGAKPPAPSAPPAPPAPTPAP